MHSSFEGRVRQAMDQARAVVEEQLSMFQSLLATQKRPAQEEAAKKRLESLR